MVFEKPTLQRERINTEFIEGQRAAKKGSNYFNPYSKVSKPVSYRQFEYGWNDQIKKNYMDKVKQLNTGKDTQGKNHHVAILVFAIVLTVIFYLVFF